jgi:hypothetical protein
MNQSKKKTKIAANVGKKGSQEVAPPSKKSKYLHITIEFLRHEVLTFIAIAFWFLLSNIPLIAAFAISFSAYWESSVLQAAPYFAKHPWRTFFTVLVLLGVIPFFKGFVKALAKKVENLFFELFGLKNEPAPNALTEESVVNSPTQLALSAGLLSFSDHIGKKLKTEDWDQCRNNIKHAKDIRIMGATGWDTFGSPQSPLYKTLAISKADVKILLLRDDPNNNVVKVRSQELNYNTSIYVSDIQKSLLRLKDLKAANSARKIEVRLYSSPLIWKMVICNTYMWLQHYWPNRNVEDTPLYTFFSDGGETPSSLFHPFYSEWQKQWDSAAVYSL